MHLKAIINSSPNYFIVCLIRKYIANPKPTMLRRRVNIGNSIPKNSSILIPANKEIRIIAII